MALKSTICGIMDHTRQTRAHCQTLVSSFRLPPSQSACPGFVAQVIGYKEKNLRFEASTRFIAALVEAALCIMHITQHS